MARIDDDVRTERRFRLLAEAVPLPVWAAGPDGRIDYTNPRWRDYSGLSAEESAGHGWLRAVHPDDRAGLRDHWVQSLAAGRPFEAELRLRRADGAYRWFLTRAEPVVDDEGRVVRWFGTSTDIDDRKREHDAALRAGADRLRLAAEAAGLGHWEWDIPADLLRWSDGLTAISGYSPAAFGATFAGFLGRIHPDDRDRVRASVERAIAEGTPYEEEMRIERADGSYRWSLGRGQVYFHRDGRPARMVGVDVDVTARREERERLRQSEARFRASVDMLLDCFAIYEAIRDDAGRIVDFRIEHVNEPACLGHRRSRDELHGRRLLEALPGHRDSGLFDRYCRVVETGEPLHLDDLAYRDDAGDPRRITVRAARLDDGLICIWRDVTDDRIAAEALRSSEERFRLAALASNGLVYDWDVVAGRVAHYGRMEALTGYRPDEVDGSESWWFDRVHPDDRAAVEAAARKARGGEADRLAVDYRIRHRDGRWVDVEDNLLVVRDAQGAVVRCIGCTFDVTERRRVERVLVESQHLASRIAEVCPVILCVFDLAEGRPIFLNREMTEALGYPREEIVARAPLGPEPLMHPDDRPRFVTHLERVRALGDGETADFEFRVRHADGSWRWFFARDAVFRRDESGAVVQLIGAALDVTGRREAEESVRRSEAEYRSLFEAAGVGNAEIELDTGRFVRANRTFCELVGYSADELRGLTSLDLTHPDDRGRNVETITPFLREDRPRFEIETRYVRKDGRIVWVYLTGTLIRDAAGRAVRLLASAHDVTERRLAEQRVRESELLFRATFDNAAVGIAHVGPDGRWLRVNEVLCKIVGFSREELLESTFQQITHPDDLARDLELASGLLEGTASTYAVEKRYVHKDGRPVWVHLTVSLIRDAEGRPDFFISVVQDVSARRQVEDEVRRLNAELDASLRRLRTILDTAPVGINVAIDPQCRVIQGNLALMEMLGMPPGGGNVSKSAVDAHTLPYRVLKDGVEAAPEALPMQRAAATGQPVDDDRYEIERGDGSRIQVLVRAQPVRDERGRVAGAVGVCVDVTALRQAEQALREADRRKNEFLAVLAHELRNPLAAIRNAVALLQVEGSADPGRPWGVEVIDRQARQLTRLVDDLLDVSRIARGKITLRRQRVDLRDVAAHAVEAVGPMLAQKEQELNVDLPPGALEVEGDPTRLEQVLLNLLTNASKYTDRGGRVELRAAAAGPDAVVRVRDTGIGIPADELRKIFDLFAQVDPAHERAQGGLGIGLTLVQNLVGLHGGRVWATSAGPGQGSEFVVQLPRLVSRASDAHAPAAPPRAASPAAAMARRRVLVVDDNVDSARGLARLLTLQGHEVTTAFDGPAAMALARDARPEFALLDIGMPGMDGYDLVRGLRTLDACRGTTFIALSGYAQDHDRRQAHAAGFDHHLVKPVDLDTLVALLSQGPCPSAP